MIGNYQRNRCNAEQLEFLISYMEDHSLLGRGQITNLGKCGHDKYWLMWNDLSAKLNSMGTCKKDAKQWEKTWKRLKLSAKEKMAEYITALNRTGNEDPNIQVTDFDERICSIFGEYGVGLAVIPEIGINFTDFEKEQLCTGSYIFDYGERLTMAQRNKSTQKQIDTLLEYMEKRPNFARKIFLSAEEYDKARDELCIILNSVGLYRDKNKWIKTWEDQTRKVMQKSRYSNNESRVLDLINTENKSSRNIDNLIPAKRQRLEPFKPLRAVDNELNIEPSIRGIKSTEKFNKPSTLTKPQTTRFNECSVPAKNQDAVDVMINAMSNHSEIIANHTTTIKEVASRFMNSLSTTNNIIKDGFAHIGEKIDNLTAVISSASNNKLNTSSIPNVHSQNIEFEANNEQLRTVHLQNKSPIKEFHFSNEHLHLPKKESRSEIAGLFNKSSIDLLDKNDGDDGEIHIVSSEEDDSNQQDNIDNDFEQDIKWPIQTLENMLKDSDIGKPNDVKKYLLQRGYTFQDD